MSPVLVGLLCGAGFATWVYTKIIRSTGGNTKNALVVAAIAFVAAFVVMILIMNFVGDLIS